jgi:hypothetical protein
MALHDLKGPFRGFEKRHLRTWEVLVLAATRSRAIGESFLKEEPEEGTF